MLSNGHTSPHIVDIDFNNAQALLIDESTQRPVLVDFWADWCAPCKSLMPILEKLANEYQGAFLLAKVNADDMQPIAQQFGVRNLPTVMLIQNGQPVDGFTGAQTESFVREMLEKVLPKPWDGMLESGKTLIAEGNFKEAAHTLKEAYELSSKRPDIGAHLAHCLAETGKLDDADTILNNIGLADQDQYFQQVKALVELKREAADTPAIRQLQAQLEASPDDMNLQYQLAVQLSQANRQPEALEILYGILKIDKEYNDNAARRSYLDILKTLGPRDHVAIEFQRKLYSLLY